MNRSGWIGLSIVLVFVIIAFIAPLAAPHSPYDIDGDQLLVGPAWQTGSWDHPLGTDDVGRDLLSRLMYGAQVSLFVGAMVVVVAAAAGVTLGLFSGYIGGWFDSMVMRAIDTPMALPSLLLAIVVVTILGQNLANSIVAVAVTAIPGFVRLVRAQVLVERQKSYVIASRTYGAGIFRQLFLNILPNCSAPIIVQGTLGFSDGILNVAALGFLGLGARPPTAEWGTMLADARAFIETAPWLVTAPGICILLVVLGFNLLGDGLRDYLDPKLKI